MAQADLYPGITEGDQQWPAHIVGHFDALVPFFQAAADDGDAIWQVVVSGDCDRSLMDEWVEQVDELDQVSAVVLRSEAVRRGLLHRVAVTMCRDRDGRILVHRRSEQVSRFPGHHEVAVGGAVAVGESYEDAAARELAEELGVRASVRFVTKFLNRSGLSPHWLGIHEAVIPVEVRPDHDEVVWHRWLAERELFGFMEQQLFTPDSGQILDQYFTCVRTGPPTDRSAAPGDQ